MAAKLGSKGGMNEINVTPLIDVVLVLLIIFMVITPVTMRTMANQLPPQDQETPPPPPDKPPDQLIVAIYKDGTLALNLRSMDDATLHDAVKARLPGMERKTVFIDAAPDANYARVVTVMDAVRDAGADKVALSELDEEGPAAPLPDGVAPVVDGATAPVPPVPPTP